LPGYQLLRLAFAGTDTLSMVFVLPLADGNPAVAATQLIPALGNLATTSVAVALPKFRFESEYSDSLLKALKASGLVAPFSGGLCVEQDSCDNFVDYVIQKTLMDVNEMGIEAAAVTAVAVGRGRPAEDEDESPPVLFMADHPTQFFVVESNNNNNADGSNEPLILFEGRVGSPAVAQDAPAVVFEALHSDADFWITNFGAEPIVVEPVVVKKSDTITTGDQNQEGTTNGNQNQETTTNGNQNQEVTTTDNQNQGATTTTTGSQDPDTTNEDQNGAPKDETSSQGPPVSLAVGTPCPIAAVIMAGLVAAALF